MKYAVRYFSRSGNTKMLADAVAKALGTEARSTDAALEEKADIVFLGSSLYAGGIDASVKAFIKDNAEKTGMIVSFGSSASGKTTLKKVQDAAAEAGVKVYDEAFNCPGHFLFMHKGRPNAEDLAGAAEFAANAAKKLGE